MELIYFNSTMIRSTLRRKSLSIWTAGNDRSSDAMAWEVSYLSFIESIWSIEDFNLRNSPLVHIKNLNTCLLVPKLTHMFSMYALTIITKQKTILIFDLKLWITEKILAENSRVKFPHLLSVIKLSKCRSANHVRNLVSSIVKFYISNENKKYQTSTQKRSYIFTIEDSMYRTQ